MRHTEWWHYTVTSICMKCIHIEMVHATWHQGSTFFHERLFGNSFLQHRGHDLPRCSGILPALTDPSSLLGRAHSTGQCTMMAFSPQSLPAVRQGWKCTHPLPQRERNAPSCLEVLHMFFQVRTGKTCASAPFCNKVRKNIARKKQMLLVCSSCSCIWMRAGKSWYLWIAILTTKEPLESPVIWTSNSGDLQWQLHFGNVMLIVSYHPFVLHLKIFFYHRFKIIKYWALNRQLHNYT